MTSPEDHCDASGSDTFDIDGGDVHVDEFNIPIIDSVENEFKPQCSARIEGLRIKNANDAEESMMKLLCVSDDDIPDTNDANEGVFSSTINQTSTASADEKEFSKSAIVDPKIVKVKHAAPKTMFWIAATTIMFWIAVSTMMLLIAVQYDIHFVKVDTKSSYSYKDSEDIFMKQPKGSLYGSPPIVSRMVSRMLFRKEADGHSDEDGIFLPSRNLFGHSDEDGDIFFSCRNIFGHDDDGGIILSSRVFSDDMHVIRKRLNQTIKLRQETSVQNSQRALVCLEGDNNVVLYVENEVHERDKHGCMWVSYVQELQDQVFMKRFKSGTDFIQKRKQTMQTLFITRCNNFSLLGIVGDDEDSFQLVGIMPTMFSAPYQQW